MPPRNPYERSAPKPVEVEPDTPVWAPGTFKETDFQKALADAVNGKIVFSDSTPWSDLARALLAIALSPRPVPNPLVENAHSVYLRHIEAAA